MKQFFKMFFAVLLALAVAGFGMFVVSILFLGALATLSQPKPVVLGDSALVFDMSVNIQDAPVGQTSGQLVRMIASEESTPNLSLLSVLRGIDAAASDDRIEGLFLKGSFVPSGYETGFAALKEVRAAIERFKESGKPVWAYVVYPSSRDLYVASVADRIYMNPEGMVNDVGMVMGAPFFGGFVKKYGIGVQVTRAGEFKSAAESFVLDKMSDPARRASQDYLDDSWAVYTNAITQAREMEEGAYQNLLEEKGLVDADDALSAGLVDQLVFEDQLIRDLQMQYGKIKEGLGFKGTAFRDYLFSEIHPEYSRDGYVAVVYAEGSIVAGEGRQDQVGGDRIARVIREARNDDHVKALVLRVNSPGGSVLGSEVIQREMRLAQEEMPVIVSMGTVAASGGYWISAYADKIYAQPNTLTGSIGVIGFFVNYKELAERHGITFDSVKSTPYADYMGFSRPKTDEEMAFIQRYVDKSYRNFLTKVAEGREMSVDAVEEIAQGRIWSGIDALEIGLVDEIGGLTEAIEFAAAEADLLGKISVKEMPEAENFLDSLFKELSSVAAQKPEGILDEAKRVYEELDAVISSLNDPWGAYSILPFNAKID